MAWRLLTQASYVGGLVFVATANGLDDFTGAFFDGRFPWVPLYPIASA